MSKNFVKRVLSGVQPTGGLHIGNYLGAIKNFVDMQNDGTLDLLVCDVTEQQVTRIEQSVDGSFVERTILDEVKAPVHAELADIDGDGDNDVLVAAMGVILPSTAYSGQIFILENNGVGQFQSHLIADQTDRVTDLSLIHI